MANTPADPRRQLAPALAACLPNAPVNRPLTGSSFIPASRTGLGELSVRNGTPRDAVVVLIPRGTAQASYAHYVRSGESSVISSIAEGGYTVKFTSGTRWDFGRTRFCEASFSEFDETLEFDEVPTKDGIKYSTWSLTLHPVANGNAQIQPSDSTGFTF